MLRTDQNTAYHRRSTSSEYTAAPKQNIFFAEMQSSALNPFAPSFVPAAAPSSELALEAPVYVYGYDASMEESITSEELEELEACEEWCMQMAEVFESEREHLIALALSQAPPEQVLAVEMKHEGFMLDEHKTKKAGKRRN